jgi:XTP/dITP diphosphohydrolase
VTELLVATTNRGKFAEVESSLKYLPLKILPLPSLGNFPVVIEEGATYEENALKKARTLAEYSGYVTLADDSGLEVDALNGAPGIYSARYSCEEGNDQKNNDKLLAVLKQVPDEKRTARFVCVLALCGPKASGMKAWTVQESCEGRIAFAPKGSGGFGYDPIFLSAVGNDVRRNRSGNQSKSEPSGKSIKEIGAVLPSIIDLRTKP